MPKVFELSTIQAIPPEHRHGTFRYLFTIWFGCNLSLLTVITGALATTTFRLGFFSGCGAIVLACWSAPCSWRCMRPRGRSWGCRKWYRPAASSALWVFMLVLAAVILMYVGFIASNLVLGAQSIHSELPGFGIDNRDRGARHRGCCRRDLRL